MGFFDRHKNSAAGEITVSDSLLQAMLSNASVDREMALSLPIVSEAVSRITNAFASVPIKLYKEEFDESGKRRVKEIQNDIRVFLLNDETGDTLNAYEMKRALCEDYLLGSGGWAYISRKRNIADGIFYVKDSAVSVLQGNNPIRKEYKIQVNGKTYKPYDFTRILRNTRDGYTSVSFIREIEKAIVTAYEALRYELRLTETGGVKKGFVKSEKKLTKEAMDALKAAWTSMYSANTENCVILNEGLDFKEASATPLEMQLKEIRDTLNNEISKTFGLNEDNAKFFKDAVTPILDEFICSLNRDLLLETEKAEGYFFAADTREVLKASIKERNDAFKTAIDGGWMTVNEVRYEENLEEIAGQNVLRGSLGSIYYDVDKKEYFVPNTGAVKEGEN